MPARQDYDVGRGRARRGLHPLGGRRGEYLDRVREPFAVRELLAVVDDVHLEADRRRQLTELAADMSGAEDVELRRRLDRLDEDVHLPSADQPRLLGEVVAELVVDELRAPGGERLARLPERVVLVAAAADGADGPPVGEDEHLRADP